MKLLIPLLLLFSIDLSGQCSTLIKSRYDKINGYSFNEQIVPITLNDENKKPSIKIQMWTLNDSGLFISINVAQVACVDEDESIYFLFTDSTRLELNNETDFNCDGHLSISFQFYDDSDKNLQLFKSKKLEAIRATTYNNSFDGYFTASKQLAFSNTLACLISKD